MRKGVPIPREVVMKRIGAYLRSALIFDKDGTLIDTETIWFETYVRLLTTQNYRHDWETHRLLMGASADVCIRTLCDKHAGLTLTQAQLFRKFAEVRAERGVNPMPGATSLIEACARPGMQIAMATSARRQETDEDLNLLGWKKFFSVVITAEDVLHHKPSPEVYLLAAQRLKREPVTCVAVEDGLNGALSAMAAGMQVIFVQDQRFMMKPPPGVAGVVSSLKELL